MAKLAMRTSDARGVQDRGKRERQCNQRDRDQGDTDPLRPRFGKQTHRLTAPPALAPTASRLGRHALLPDAFAEEPGRTEHQNTDQHHESKHVLVIAAENIIGLPSSALDDAEQNTAQHRPGKVADAAEHGRRECFHAQKRTHGVVRNAVIGSDHHAGDRCQGRADDESEGDDAIDVYPHQARHLRVLRRRAHGDAELGAIHDQRQPAHHQQRNHNDGNLHPGNDRAADSEADERNDLRKRERAAAPDQKGQMLQDDGDADGGDQRRKSRRALRRGR